MTGRESMCVGWGVANQGDDHDAEEVEVGDAPELLKQVLGQEVPPRVPRRHHLVRREARVGVCNGGFSCRNSPAPCGGEGVINMRMVNLQMPVGLPGERERSTYLSAAS